MIPTIALVPLFLALQAAALTVPGDTRPEDVGVRNHASSPSY